jgi:hypothetical protein
LVHAMHPHPRKLTMENVVIIYYFYKV